MREIKPKELEINPFKEIGVSWMLISAKKGDKVNTMTASWGALGVIWEKDAAFMFIRKTRYTKEFVEASDTFSLSFFDKKYKKELAYLGRVSGRDEDKITKSGLSVLEDGNTPYFKEAKMVLICKKVFSTLLGPNDFIDPIINDFYPLKDYHTMYIGHIKKILIEE